MSSADITPLLLPTTTTSSRTTTTSSTWVSQENDLFFVTPTVGRTRRDTAATGQMISCKVCQSMISLEGQPDKAVVKCQHCNEATPIRPAPAGKKYVRCSCHCLLICKADSRRIQCARANCGKLINLCPQRPPQTTTPGLCRIVCVHCNDVFYFNTLNHSLARCSHCRRFTSVGSERRSARRGFWLSLIGFVILIIGIAITIGTLSYTYQAPGLYVLYIAIFLAAASFILRGLFYCSLKVSQIAGPL